MVSRGILKAAKRQIQEDHIVLNEQAAAKYRLLKRLCGRNPYYRKNYLKLVAESIHGQHDTLMEEQKKKIKLAT